MASAGICVSALPYFDLSADVFPWRDPHCQKIERRRAALGDLLLFDILLQSGGIREPDTIYPPVDGETFHRLLAAIQSSTYDALKQDCLVYFLLKWYCDGREERFKADRCIPPHFASLSDAYWYLDAGVDIPRAVSILSDARLNTDYASKILQAISLAQDPMPLVLKYVRTSKALLTEPDDIDLYTLALAETSLSEAWRFQRTFNEESQTRERLVQKILDWCFTPAPRRSALIQLLGIALTPYEQNLIHEFATPAATRRSTLPPDSIATLQNLLCVRLIQNGQYADAIKLDRKFSSASPMNLSLQAERTTMVQDVYAALSSTEQMILNLELESPSPKRAASGGGHAIMSGPRSTKELDASMSWEDIRAPTSPVRPATIPHHMSAQRQTLLGSSPAINRGFHDSKFGELGVSQAPSVFPRPAFNISSSSTQPLAPVVPGTSVPRDNLTFQSDVSFARQPLSQSTSRAFDLSSASQKSLFDSANKKPNAFYQPPANLPRRDAVSLPPLHDSNVANAGPSGFADIDMDQDDDRASEAARENDELAEESLGYSVFGSEPVRASKRAGAGARPQQAEAKRIPPGGFMSDEDPDPDAAEPQPPPARQTRRSVAAAATKTQPDKNMTTPVKKRGKAQKQEPSRVLPGSLMNSEDDSGDEGEGEDEDGDRLAPLPRRHEATVGEKVQTRRRSSRLSSTSEAESRPQKEKVSGKTRTAAGSGRKRRS